MGAFVDLDEQPHAALAPQPGWSDQRSLSFSSSPAPASFPHQKSVSSHNLPCTLCSHSVPSTQGGLHLPIFICLQIPGYSSGSVQGSFSKGHFPPNTPPSPGLLASRVSVSSWCSGWQYGAPNHTRIQIQAPSFTSTDHVTLSKILNLSVPP